MSHFDLIVIGAGPGGYPAAIRASQLGLKTAVVERDAVGGVCLNVGCVPSKALLKSAELIQKIRHQAADFGIQVGEPTVDFPAVIGRSRAVSERFKGGVQHLFKKYGVTLLSGEGTLTGAGQVEVRSDEGSITYTADHVVLATGSRARQFPGIQADGDRIWTYREAILSTQQAESIIILGAGAIGMEFAYFLNAMGTEVTVVEGLNEILPAEDAEIASVARKELQKQGVRFQLGSFVKSVEGDNTGTRVELANGTVLTASHTLIALGISPNTEDLGLEALGVTTERGFVIVDESMRTNVPGLYAVGDMTQRGGLAHTATRQAHVCVERIAGEHVPDVNYKAIPGCTYTQPQVASVGLTEAQAKAQGLNVKVGRFPFVANAKAWGAGHPEGLVKVLISEEYGEIVGAHIVGGDATEMIAELVMAIEAEATAHTLLHAVHAHPTHSEVVLEAVAQALGVSVHI